MTTVKKYNSTQTITITETNYAAGSNKGEILGRTLKPAYSQFVNGKRVSFIWKDVDSKDKFMTVAIEGKMAIKNMEFSKCTMWKGFDNSEPASFTPVDWTKSNPICLNYTVNKE